MFKNKFIISIMIVLALIMIASFKWYVFVNDSKYISESEFLELKDYSLEEVRKNKKVPRVFLKKLPKKLKSIEDTNERKELFIKSILPLVLYANEEILIDRKMLLSIKESSSADAQAKILSIKLKYDIPEKYNIEQVLSRVDEIPVSLALAQAALETGWGTSRFSQEGNALYGERTWGENGIKPQNIDDNKKFKVRKFNSIEASIRSYIHNLNTSSVYLPLRKERKKQRQLGKYMSGKDAVEHMAKYSEINENYEHRLKRLINGNHLYQFDGASLK